MIRRTLLFTASCLLLLSNYVLGIAQKTSTDIEQQIVTSNETLDSLVVNNVNLEVHGQITHDLHAQNSHVTLFEGCAIHEIGRASCRERV